MISIRGYIERLSLRAKEASVLLGRTPTAVKDRALLAMAAGLESGRRQILSANRRDLRAARAKGISGALLDRLMLNPGRIDEMARGLREVAKLPDPVGELIHRWSRPNGLKIAKVRVPIGVIGIIYEARPNVTADCAGLCLKSGNSVILRGGSEAIRSNRAIFRRLESAALRAGLPPGAVSLVSTTDRRAVEFLLGQVGVVDLVIPRGGEGLIRQVVAKARVPVIKQYKGVCHTFVDEGADLKMAEEICYNAKVQRPGVCNAMETLLVHRRAAPSFLPAMARRYLEAHVELRGDARTRRILKGLPVRPAAEEDWATEYLGLILSVKVVGSLEEAIGHIRRYGSNHSDAIVTRSKPRADRFLREIDSACVYVNASTRFTDGGQFGLGAEIGVSTDKLHARGPMGLEELTTYKYLVTGQGQVRK
ncbi:MAG: glutamate-5-semialdehyde dehydrogenase [Candidatus Omnitrophica bacterium]|nr:glutamate-5-semialdehyde dehydrogenase [Candidatus Omnitrophota bacterium]